MRKITRSILSLVLLAALAGMPLFAAAQAPELDNPLQRTAQQTASPSSFDFGAFGKNEPDISLLKPSSIIGWIGTLMLSGAGFFTWAGGTALNVAVNVAVVHMGSFVKEIAAVNVTWGVLRDLANILFIFILLAIGIATILQIEGYGMKSLLAQVIVIAVLINFSLFFTKLIVDASNIFAVQFYNAMNLKGCNPAAGAAAPGGSLAGFAGLNCSDAGLSERFMNALKLQSLYGTSAVKNILGTGAAELSGGKIFLIALLGSVFLLVAAFIFFAAAILFAKRFAVLVMLMVLSPLAFIAMALPKTKGYASEWWKALLNNSIFAPIYLLLIWIVLKILEDPGFSIVPSQNSNFALALSGAGSSVIIFVNFLIVGAFLVFALIVSQKLGVYGAEGMMKLGHTLRKWGQGVAGGATLGGLGLLGRNTFGRLGSKIASLEVVKNLADRSRFGENLLKANRWLAKSSFDVRAARLGKATIEAAIPGGLGKAGGKGGYEETLKKQKEERKRFADSIKGVDRGALSPAQEQRIEELKKEKAEIGKSLREKEREVLALNETDLPAEAAREDLLRAQRDARAREAEIAAEKARIEAAPEGADRRDVYGRRIGAQREPETAYLKVPRKNKEAADELREAFKKEGVYDRETADRLEKTIALLRGENKRIAEELEKAEKPLLKELGELRKMWESAGKFAPDPGSRDSARRQIETQLGDIEKKLEEIRAPARERTAKNTEEIKSRSAELAAVRKRSQRASAQDLLKKLVEEEIRPGMKSEIEKSVKEARAEGGGGEKKA